MSTGFQIETGFEDFHQPDFIAIVNGSKQPFPPIYNGYPHQVEAYVFNEPLAAYKTLLPTTEEDVKLNSMHGHHYIDASHIVPFRVSHDDRVVNGIALCPNMHRAFDRELLSISDDYRILVSRDFAEDENHPYSLFFLTYPMASE